LILDPFMESGTTGVACEKLGRPADAIPALQQVVNDDTKALDAA
jgi:hypothetical protein